MWCARQSCSTAHPAACCCMLVLCFCYWVSMQPLTRTPAACCLQVGYSISASGDIVPTHSGSFVGPFNSVSGAAPSGSLTGSVINQLFHRHSAASPPGGTSTGGNTISGMTSMPSGGFLSLTGSTDGTALHGRPSVAYSGLDSLQGGLQSGLSGSLTGASQGLVGAVPPVEGLVTNPVLANLEAAFASDPRRHRRNDSKLSSLSIGSLHRCGRHGPWLCARAWLNCRVESRGGVQPVMLIAGGLHDYSTLCCVFVLTEPKC